MENTQSNPTPRPQKQIKLILLLSFCENVVLERIGEILSISFVDHEVLVYTRAGTFSNELPDLVCVL